MEPSPDPYPSPCYGIDIAEDGAVVVAERLNGKIAPASRFSSGNQGVVALREHIARTPARPRVCIRSCGAAALAVAIALAALPGGEIMLVAPRAIEATGRSGRDATAATPEERAQQLARMAGHLY